ncbi:hypothetical protein ALC57_06814 [Trachymyrmex cornetzi]|uniref:Uncharacterized protein n=1 Tax=Trachymyrmex cornetzi TaxID=471704 RepID=A0A195E7U0_9HYME|nr:hypothetical protein ALC57_06814 [Trachymyrmex cornetzi]
MYNNLIPKPGTIHVVRKYYSSFERERSLSNFACTVNAKTRFVLLDIILRAAYSLRQPSSFTSQTGSNDLDFSPIIMDANISVKVIPYGAVARRSQRRRFSRAGQVQITGALHGVGWKLVLGIEGGAQGNCYTANGFTSACLPPALTLPSTPPPPFPPSPAAISLPRVPFSILDATRCDATLIYHASTYDVDGSRTLRDKTDRQQLAVAVRLKAANRRYMEQRRRHVPVLRSFDSFVPPLTRFNDVRQPNDCSYTPAAHQLKIPLRVGNAHHRERPSTTSHENRVPANDAGYNPRYQESFGLAHPTGRSEPRRKSAGLADATQSRGAR